MRIKISKTTKATKQAYSYPPVLEGPSYAAGVVMAKMAAAPSLATPRVGTPKPWAGAPYKKPTLDLFTPQELEGNAAYRANETAQRTQRATDRAYRAQAPYDAAQNRLDTNSIQNNPNASLSSRYMSSQVGNILGNMKSDYSNRYNVPMSQVNNAGTQAAYNSVYNRQLPPDRSQEGIYVPGRGTRDYYLNQAAQRNPQTSAQQATETQRLQDSLTQVAPTQARLEGKELYDRIRGEGGAPLAEPLWADKLETRYSPEGGRTEQTTNWSARQEAIDNLARRRDTLSSQFRTRGKNFSDKALETYLNRVAPDLTPQQLIDLDRRTLTSRGSMAGSKGSVSWQLAPSKPDPVAAPSKPVAAPYAGPQPEEAPYAGPQPDYPSNYPLIPATKTVRPPGKGSPSRAPVPQKPSTLSALWQAGKQQLGRGVEVLKGEREWPANDRMRDNATVDIPAQSRIVRKGWEVLTGQRARRPARQMGVGLATDAAGSAAAARAAANAAQIGRGSSKKEDDTGSKAQIDDLDAALKYLKSNKAMVDARNGLQGRMDDRKLRP